MAKNRLSRLFFRVVGLKPGEEKLAVLLFIYFFLIASPHTILKALRYADILTTTGTGGLPIAYLLSATITGLAVLFHSRIHSRISSQSMITASLIFFIVTGLLLNFLVMTNSGSESEFLSYLFWVWASVLTIVLITQFWLTINEVFNLRAAKRLIGFFGAGGILGGIAGGLLAKFLTQANLANFLLPLACGLLFVCVLVVRAIFVIRQKKLSSILSPAPKKEPPDVARAGFADTFYAVRKNNYLVLITALVAITVIVSTLIDFQFSSAVNEIFPYKEAKQAFFGLFYAVLLTVSFFLSLFLTSYILKNSRPRFPLLLTPLALLLCSLVILFMPFTLILASLLKGGDESLGFSLHQPVREILYVPIAPDLKAKVKLFIDMFISRFAKVLAAILLLLYAMILGKNIHNLSPTLDMEFSKDLIYVVAAFLILWVIAALMLGKEHNRIIRKKIEIVWSDAYVDIKKADVDLAKLICDTMESKDRSSVLYALHLFDLLERGKLTPELKKMISQRSGEATASSLGDLFGAEGAAWFPGNDDDIPPERILADIKEIMSSDAYQQLMRLHAEGMREEGDASEIERMELAKLIGLMNPDAPLVEKLETLILDDSPQVSSFAIRSAARLKKAEHIPAVIHKLRDPKTHEDAVNALEAYGHSAMNILEKYLFDCGQAIPSRKAVVEVLAGIGSEKAVKLLLRELGRNAEELEKDIVDALDRIRSERPEIRFPSKQAKKATLSIIKKYCQTYVDLQNLEHSEGNEQRELRMKRDLEAHFKSIFSLLGLYYPHDDMVKAFQNLREGTKDSVSDAIDLIDITLKKKMKNLVLPLVEDLNPQDKQRMFQKILRKLDSS